MRKLAQIQAFNGGFSPNVEITSSNWGSLTTATAWINKFIADGATGVLVKNFSLVGNTVKFYLKVSATTDIRLNALNITSITIFTFTKCNRLFLNNNSLTTIAAKLPAIGELQLQNNQIQNVNFAFPLPSMYRLYINSNVLTSFNPSYQLVGVAYLWLNRNLFTEFNPSIALPSSIIELDLSGNKLTKFNPSIPLPTNTRIINLVNNLINNTGWVDSEPWANNLHTTANGVLKYGGNTSSPIGTNFESILTSKGWTFSAY